ncbi:carbohydrate ABC transporter membrane protein 2 (CUT1 family) [Melghirimyces profundicolus]|uniref:Carbohydrate ABC transporter membrane protein 2 (CUT1 family) n=1 Tax=Melghirimyces profundicolus TaxID=1242148 RepID=A0A2T6C9L9_9BACL|nr:sugar ABC transporter permease [Melghirimyces profundicolus]PTX65002.1 carbohydrate ABC transporter membrane protein 2 (CUT1 family) [Melghirimyces profundicolus]
MTAKWQSHLGLIVTYAILLFMVAVTLYPILWVIGSSLNPGTSLYSSSLIPQNATLKHYTWLFTSPESQYVTWYLNTLKIAGINSLLSVLLTSLTAYAFSRYKFVGRKYGLMSFLVLQMFPSIMAMVAFYILLSMVKLLDTHLGLILIYAGGQIPFNTYLVKGYFDSIPRGLDEAAKIDGAGHNTIFFRIMLPLAKPILAVVALFNFITPMTDFLLPQIVLTSPEKQTLAVGLFGFINEQFNNNFTQFAAGSVLVAIPIAVVFLLLQRYFVTGLATGATKG